jgi:hypothetical protein
MTTLKPVGCFCRLATLQWWRGEVSRAKSDLLSVSFYSKFTLTPPARTHVLNCICLKDVSRHSTVTNIIFWAPPTKVEGPLMQILLLSHQFPYCYPLLLPILALKSTNAVGWCFLSAQQHLGDILASFIKQSAQQGRTKREDPSLSQNPKWVTKGQRNKLCSKAPPPIARTIYRKGRETWKSSKPRRAFTCNDCAPQNRSSMHFLQGYQHSLPIEDM